MKIIISDPKTGRAYQKEINDDEAQPFYRKTIGDEVDLSPMGLTGYVASIQGGTDKDGFPMRKDVHGTGRKAVLIGSGQGIKRKRLKYKGERRRKTVRGNTVAEDIAQLNIKIVKYGDKEMGEIFGVGEGEAKTG